MHVFNKTPRTNERTNDAEWSAITVIVVIIDVAAATTAPTSSSSLSFQYCGPDCVCDGVYVRTIHHHIGASIGASDVCALQTRVASRVRCCNADNIPYIVRMYSIRTQFVCDHLCQTQDAIGKPHPINRPCSNARAF